MLSLKPKKQGNRKVKAARNLKDRAKIKNVKPFVIASLVSVLMVSVVLIHERLSQQILFPITQVAVIGKLKNISNSELSSLVLNDLQQGFFDIDLNAVAQDIEAINWVAQATLRRVWPNKVEILIREHQAVAIWDDKTLISTNGILFEVETMDQFKHLALVTGKKMNAKALLLAYSELEQLTKGFGLQIIHLKRIKSGEMAVKFNTNLHSIFALKDKDTQFKRFVALLESGFIGVKENTNIMNEKTLKSIDMRYSNGFSVVWKEPQIKLNKKLAKDANGKQHV